MFGLTIANMLYTILAVFGFVVVLTVCGVIADHLFPHIKPIQKFLDSLPVIE